MGYSGLIWMCFGLEFGIVSRTSFDGFISIGICLLYSVCCIRHHLVILFLLEGDSGSQSDRMKLITTELLALLAFFWLLDLPLYVHAWLDVSGRSNHWRSVGVARRLTLQHETSNKLIRSFDIKLCFLML